MFPVSLSCRAIPIACALLAFVRLPAAQGFDISDLALDDWEAEAVFGLVTMMCYDYRAELVRL